MTSPDIRELLIARARACNASGLSAGTSGNLSARVPEGYLITPSGVSYAQLEPPHLVKMDLRGEYLQGDLEPSSEWRLHQAVYLARDAINAIVHVHSDYATALACARLTLPAFHYMVAVAGGADIRCADYATFGTQALADNAVSALHGRRACLLANHGMIAAGADIADAYRLAETVEQLARQYWLTVLIGGAGGAVILDDDEMKINLEKFNTYGQYKRPGKNTTESL